MKRADLVVGESYRRKISGDYPANDRVVAVSVDAPNALLGTQFHYQGVDWTVRHGGPGRWASAGALLLTAERYPSVEWFADCREVVSTWADYVAKRTWLISRTWKIGDPVVWVSRLDGTRRVPYLASEGHYKFGTFAGVGPRRDLPELRGGHHWCPPADWEGVMVDVDGIVFWVADGQYLMPERSDGWDLVVDRVAEVRAEAEKVRTLDNFRAQTVKLLRAAGISDPRLSIDKEGRPRLSIGIGGIVALAGAPDDVRQAIVDQLGADAALQALGG